MGELEQSHSAEAVNATAVAQEAVEKARKAQMMSALDEFFQQRTADGRFIDIKRIPFICDDIRGIHENLKELNETTKEMKPLIQAAAGSKILFKVFVSIGSLAAAWIAMKQLFGF